MHDFHLTACGMKCAQNPVGPYHSTCYHSSNAIATLLDPIIPLPLLLFPLITPTPSPSHHAITSSSTTILHLCHPATRQIMIAQRRAQLLEVRKKELEEYEKKKEEGEEH